ncbi:pentapeptide repeat-containing protein [Methylobacterium sp. ID0610]|uniref:pentapeptide repeat-containing protein n=1 Tax=Methylobacterium carpenticola TaxID=3344827 RepID=UPI00367B92DC
MREPEARTASFLALLRHGGTPFQAAEPPQLAGLRADRESLRGCFDPAAEPPPWWDAACEGLHLAGAQLGAANLVEADLTGANLSRANLAGVLARSARFEVARIEETDFTGGDLSGAHFAGVAGGQAVFADAMLEDARFTGAALRFATLRRALLDGADFTRADLWGADFTDADADDTHFRQARLDEAVLVNVNLTGADFEGASLKKARLTGSRLRGANLSGAKLDGADLSGADLSDTQLVRLNLTTCSLRHARFANAWLDGTRLRIGQLGGAVGEEAAGDYAGAVASYLALERNMRSIGDRAGASWAFKRARRMGRHHAGQRALAAWRARDWRAGLRDGYGWAADRFVEWLCDYGESLSRIVRAFALAILLFALLYGLTGGLIPEGRDGSPTYNPLDLVSYSALNMMTANQPELGIKPVGRLTNALVGTQGALGIILMGLFGYVLGNRFQR